MTLNLMLGLGAVLLLALAVIFGLSRWAMRSQARFARLALLTTVLTFILIVVGAYVRLSDAGLGCPDWPGCYGEPHVPEVLPASHGEGVPAGGFDAAKGWKEMGHRYLASFVGMLIAALALAALRARRSLGRSPILPLLLVLVVIAQAALGRWTVTLLLKPAIVTLHLIGGMTTLALLVWITLGASRRFEIPIRIDAAARVRGLALLGLLAVCLQIVLGGWVSTNYAALACPDLPGCQGQWVPPMSFAHAFDVLRELGRTGDGGLLPLEALTAIHWVHRLGAIGVFVVALWLGLRLVRIGSLKSLGVLLVVLVCLQLALGMGNVLFSLPLWLAAAHNAGAAGVLVTMVVINYALSRSGNS